MLLFLLVVDVTCLCEQAQGTLGLYKGQVIGTAKLVEVEVVVATLAIAYCHLVVVAEALIDTVNDELNNIAQIEHSRHRSFNNFIANALSAIAAYCFFEKKPSIDVDFINDR